MLYIIVFLAGVICHPWIAPYVLPLWDKLKDWVSGLMNKEEEDSTPVAEEDLSKTEDESK